jgi:nicotinamide mononucleotide (NMN) deamidase PncC
VQRLQLQGDRASVRAQTVEQALQALIAALANA